MYQILQKNDDISIKEDYRKNNGFDFTKKRNRRSYCGHFIFYVDNKNIIHDFLYNFKMIL